MTTMNQFDPDDYVEACDVPGCPARYGLGDHEHGRAAVAYTSYGPCHWCKRDTDSTSVNVRLDSGEVVVCCDTCWSKRDEDYLDERLDMTDE